MSKLYYKYKVLFYGSVEEAAKQYHKDELIYYLVQRAE